ncbi:S-adenosyl-L-methionine-dependent methyltransferase [Microdochium trichocladiopsis]|uniref:Leucine carboxyl methyltransferase 1 n=1 Tax=Microdochium trichocladiopsis TaxID=1682393 RepID=A0A9P9BQQ0_9PEZI|nr:S-adenosyl-L-methionine-dependent methyltransferase [Microdochium trichocladiopsis]KAH7031142.1 S-adenosyl-L-methionine-dependent methyltransferase [Microdochium trichocladiopsis]
MSAPSIPNLLSLRGTRGGARGRLQRRGGGPPAAQGTSPAPSNDAVVQGTDTDAALSRMSAVDLGYLQDPYAALFVQRPTVGLGRRRLPIINRGTYARTTGIDRLVDLFLAEAGGHARQIISLGAGTDTRAFRMLAQGQQSRLIYHEVDFPTTSGRKLQLVQAVPALRAILPEAQGSEVDWSSTKLPNECQYWCHGVDLRELSVDGGKSLEGVRSDVPTLVISECCLCYLEVGEATGVVKHFTDKIPDLSLVLYEPILPHDAFGQQMVSNLAARRLRMPTVQTYIDMPQQQKRLRDAGFEQARSMTIGEVWKHWTSPNEKTRVDSLEGLDEVEEWDLLASHYMLAWGWRGDGFGGWNRS